MPDAPARFRVEKSWAFVADACLVAGVLEAGTLRPPIGLRVLPAPGSGRVERAVQAKGAATAQNRASVELTEGTRGRLLLSGGPLARGGSLLGWQPASVRWIDTGDVLVPG